jgi:hypothetical protein
MTVVEEGQVVENNNQWSDHFVDTTQMLNPNPNAA